ncbi:MAG: glycosyltransferase, partial [bacterium]
MSIKVCFLSDVHPIFDDRIYWKEALSLKKHGYDIYFISMDNDSDNEGKTKEGIKFIKIKRKIYFKNRILNKIYKILFQKEFHHEIFKHAKKVNADIYHSHNINILHILDKLKKFSTNPKIIHCIRESYPDMIRDYKETKGFNTLFKNIYARYIEMWEIKKIKNTDYLITIDDAGYEKFSRYKQDKNIELIYNFSTNFMENKDSKNREYDLIYVGGISEVRGIIKIVEAVSIAKKRINKIKVLFIGKIYNSLLKDKLIKKIKSLSLEKNVFIKDPVPHKEIDKFLTNSRIGIVTLLPIPKFYKN